MSKILPLFLLLFMWGGAAAQNYPAKPINFVLPFPPGTPDMAARVYAETVSAALGQRIVASNVGGGGGVQAALQVKNAAPDGYTMFAGSSGTMALLKAVRADLPYDPEKDFQPVTLLFSMPTFVTVQTGVPFTSMAELIAFAKKNPGKLTFGSQGVASPGHFQGAMLIGFAGVDIVHIPYKGGIAQILDLVAQRVDMGFNTWSATREYVRAGKLRYLAITTEARRSEEPDVPTLAELGFRGVEHDTWIGLFVPARTPDAVVTRLNLEFVRASGAPEVVKRLNAEGFLIRSGPPDQLRRALASDSEILRAAARKYSIKAD